MLVFNFQKMMDMHKVYAYQFSDFIVLKKKCNKEPRFLEPNQNLLYN